MGAHMPNECCPFCSADKALMKNLFAYARYDNYPVSQGHLLIVPFRHVSDYFELSEEEYNAIRELTASAKKLLDQEQKPDGYNLGVNCGTAAGQTIDHVHIHLIPRYKGEIEDPRGGVRGVIPQMQKY